jgi:hypothetical protein
MERPLFGTLSYVINFDHVIHLSKLNLISKILVVRRSKCQACVQSKQPHKPFKRVKEKSLVPLELIHSNLCEMNVILTKGGKTHFISFIDDATRWCELYLIKMKDDALDYFQIYKAEAGNQLEKIVSGLIEEENIFLMISVNIVQNKESSMRLRRPTHPNQMGLLNKKIEHLRTWLMPC